MGCVFKSGESEQCSSRRPLSALSEILQNLPVYTFVSKAKRKTDHVTSAHVTQQGKKKKKKK